MTQKPDAILYGIPNCDTVRKARAWMDQQRIAYRFHDFRAEPVDRQTLTAWVDALGEGRALNRASTTFRALSELHQQATGEALIDLMMEHPTLIRRPVLAAPGILLNGFKPDAWTAALSPKAND
jgi:arsenate reductase (glutaredoxin)